MKIKVELDEKLINRALQLTGIKENSDLLETALKVLISIESSNKLVRFSGKQYNLRNIKRRRYSF